MDADGWYLPRVEETLLAAGKVSMRLVARKKSGTCCSSLIFMMMSCRQDAVEKMLAPIDSTCANASLLLSTHNTGTP
jgi:hypothetical protein